MAMDDRHLQAERGDGPSTDRRLGQQLAIGAQCVPELYIAFLRRHPVAEVIEGHPAYIHALLVQRGEELFQERPGLR